MRNAIRTTTIAVLIGGAALGLAGTSHAAAYGDADSATPYWSQQTLDDCMLMAVADVVGQITGTTPSEADIIAVAGATPSRYFNGPVYTPATDIDDPSTWSKTDSRDEMTLLTHYGISSTNTDDYSAEDGGLPTGMTALEKYLNQGRKVIVSVNAETLWGEDGDHNTGDHAVVVTSVDTDNGIVHLNDSGPDDGADEQVSTATFETAWKAADHDMVVTNA